MEIPSWRHFPGEVILLRVRWYLRYPLAYEHVSELLAEGCVEVAPSCIWRWVQEYGQELERRCRQHLKPTNKSYRTDETYIKVRAKTSICTVPWTQPARRSTFCSPPSGTLRRPNASSARARIRLAIPCRGH